MVAKYSIVRHVFVMDCYIKDMRVMRCVFDLRTASFHFRTYASQTVPLPFYTYNSWCNKFMRLVRTLFGENEFNRLSAPVEQLLF